MNAALYAAVALTVGIGVAHSLLGERYILTRLFRRDDLPRLFGGTEFTKNTLRFAWHITSLAWFGFAGILVAIAEDALTTWTAGLIVGITFAIHFLITLIASRGRHFAWVVFLAISILAITATWQ